MATRCSDYLGGLLCGGISGILGVVSVVDFSPLLLDLVPEKLGK